jgi:hypothetical protein
MSDILNEKQAYKAMFYFLEELFEKQGFDELGGLLGSMNILPDGKPADPAMWNDWKNAIHKVNKGNSEG